MSTKKTIPYIISLMFFTCIGCNRSDFLNVKPQKSLVIPETLDHLQMILDDDATMNGATSEGLTPQLGESGSDNFYIRDADFSSLMLPQTQNFYVWKKNPYLGGQILDWEFPYKAVLNANTVLDRVKNIERTNQNKAQYDKLIGQALFHRAHMYYQLAQVFAPAYNPDSDNSELGIVLRLEADINESLRRITVQETYDQIIADLVRAIALLDDQSVHKSRASKQAAYGLMARVHLTMREYEKARMYADSCLDIQSELFDYNLLDASVLSPFKGTHLEHPVNKEVIFYSAMLSNIGRRYPTSPFLAKIDEDLYASYDDDDLRRSVYFQKQEVGYRFKGSYSYRGYDHYFSGIAVDEILLIRAECLARIGETEAALNDLNRLLLSRFKENSYAPYRPVENSQVLTLILEERRKELLFRGLRWSDLRRLNQEGYDITLKREIDGQVHALPPNDPRWTWPLPLNVTAQ